MFSNVGFYKFGVFSIGQYQERMILSAQYPLECFISLCFKMYN